MGRDAWRAHLGTQAYAAELGDAIARGLVVWSSSDDASRDGCWVEPSSHPIVKRGYGHDNEPLSAQRGGRASK